MGSAADFLPERTTLPSMREAVQGCRGCDLYKDATQAVFGEGPGDARVVMVGEQPGDKEDLAGRPFVGPAGGLLDRAIEEAGLVRDDVYITNVVKHFSHVMRGKRRIHKKPNAEQIKACTPWLEAELARTGPDVLVLLGATAAQAMLGRSFRVTQQRGTFVESPLAPLVTATIHPSSILRAETDEDRRVAFEGFVRDLHQVAAALRRRAAS
ncbi:MAG TPA: UdgX family uracil-DNA binding protein [Actinomycetota bacterium]|jgi:DNA polymerase|nr:UdgX family uracil-DNA binding protein [Actinomycetota bacterium]